MPLALYKKGSPCMQTTHTTSTMKRVIILCMSLSAIIGQPVPEKMSDKAGDINFSSAVQGMQLMADIMKEIMGAGPAVMPPESATSNQESVEKSPESLQVKPSPKEELLEPSSCDGPQCGETLTSAEKPNTVPSKEETPLQSPWMDTAITSVTNGESMILVWFTFGIDLLRKLLNLPDIRMMLDTNSITELSESMKEYIRTVDQGNTELKNNMIDSLEVLANLLINPILKFVS